MNDLLSEIIDKNIPSASLKSYQTITGGCINSSVKLKTTEGFYFLKWNDSALEKMFQAEHDALKLLAEKSSIRIPKIINYGTIRNKSYLLTEWIDQGVKSPHFWNDFGEKLAFQHKINSEQFGLDSDNFIGSLNQSNKQHKEWSNFFILERLTPQIELAEINRYINNDIIKKFEIIFKKLNELIPTEQPALLHGDLWSGNFMTSNTGEAVIFDPSAHYGHRETEIAFTQLFGGFESNFYHSYRESFPLEPHFEERVDLHNLYPLLVHVNLFGSTYLPGIIQTLNRFA